MHRIRPSIPRWPCSAAQPHMTAMQRGARGGPDSRPAAEPLRLRAWRSSTTRFAAAAHRRIATASGRAGVRGRPEAPWRLDALAGQGRGRESASRRRTTPGGGAWHSDAAVEPVLILRLGIRLASRQARGFANAALSLLGDGAVAGVTADRAYDGEPVYHGLGGCAAMPSALCEARARQSEDSLTQIRADGPRPVWGGCRTNPS